MKNCTFTYKGKSWSKARLLDHLTKELPQNSQEESITFLTQNLGMSRDEIIIIAGLIDGKSLGRFKADGRILLSDLSDLRTAKHEAFHRVWRMYLSADEQTQIIRYYKKQNIDLSGLKKLYPNHTEAELYEEYFAFEFEDYELQPDTYPQSILKSTFTRLLNFIKKLLGINKGK